VGELSARDRAVLDFERRWWRSPGAKAQAVRETFDLSTTRYYQVLNALLDDPDALAADPVLVQRLRRLREARTAARTGGAVPEASDGSARPSASSPHGGS
jgi:hypothetical protein